MKKTIYLFLLLNLFSCKTPDPEKLNPFNDYLNTDISNDSESHEKIKKDYYQLVQLFRESKGLKALTVSPEIERLALEHSENMANKTVPFGHDGSSERCTTLRTELGPANLCGEIVAFGQKSPEAVFAAWMKDPAHRGKFENSRYTHTGLGYFINNEGITYWTQIFLEVQ